MYVVHITLEIMQILVISEASYLIHGRIMLLDIGGGEVTVTRIQIILTF